jgi:hypothetical protein
LGWKGVLIELNGDKYEKLVRNRPNEIAAIHAGVCSQKKTLHAVTTEGRNKVDTAVGGIWEFTAPSFREMWWKGVTLDSPNVREVECDTLDNLLLTYAPQATMFEFMSLDAEGAEMSVLESIDFTRVAFGIILIEADGLNPLKNSAMAKFLETKGYSIMLEYERSYWFVNDNFYEDYKDLIY